MPRDLAPIEGIRAPSEKNPRPPVWQLRRAWLQGGLFYVLVVVPTIAGFNHRGPLAPFLAPRPIPRAITVYAATKARAPASRAEPDNPPATTALRLIELVLLLSIPAQLIFVTLRWLNWNNTEVNRQT